MARILYFILDGFPTFRPDIEALWGKYMPREGIKSDIMTLANDEKKTGNWGGGIFYRVAKRRNRILQEVFWFIQEIWVIIRVKRDYYSAIQVRDMTFICVFAILKARRLGVPFFYWMSFPMVEALQRVADSLDRRRQFLRWLFLWWRGHVGAYVLYRWVLPRADHVFVQSHKMMSDLALRGVENEKMTAVPMCVDPDRFVLSTQSPERDSPWKAKSGPVCAYLGTCERARRIDFILESFATARKSVPSLRLMIIGDATEEADKKWLRNCIVELGLSDYVDLTGWLPAAEAQSLLMKADVALALMAPDPLLDSTSPTKLVEYLALAKPVVANDHPDQKKVLADSGAGFCVPFNQLLYANAIVKLLADKDLMVSMGQKGREYVLQNRNYRSMASSLADVYRDLLSR